MRKSGLLALGIFVVFGAACASGSDSDPDPAPETTTTKAPSSSVELQPVENVLIGSECEEPGRLGLTSYDQQLLCSGSTETGEVLEVPVWRDAAGRDFKNDSGLSVSEMEAISLARIVDPALESEGDHSLVIMVAEYAQTMNLAAESDIPVDEGFYRLVEGVMAQNGFSVERGMSFTKAMVAASGYLQADDAPGRFYAAEMIWWLENDLGDG